VELLERKSSGSGFKKNEITAVGIRRADYATHFYPQKLALTSSTSGGRSVVIDRPRIKATELLLLLLLLFNVGSLTSHNPIGLHGLLQG
jgi:hypothetical protein